MGTGTTMVSGKVRKDLSTKTYQNGNIPIVASTENRSSSRKKKMIQRRNKETVICPVQKLFETCKKVFANCKSGTVPSPQHIQMLRAVLDEIKPEDVGVSPKMPFFRSKMTGRSPLVTYLHIHKCHRFSIGIFCLPPSGVIPLHNHPEMTVFSKLLFGTIHIKSYDWVSDSPQPSLDTRLAKVKVDSEFTAPCDTSILYPTDGGNLHCFIAKTACAVLDVLGPPYSDPAGRHCTYYFDYPFSSYSVDGVDVPEEEKEGYAWLKEREEEPEDLKMSLKVQKDRI
ncbi:unnamed protein product [Arabis nemorensis]|uniref:cysteine dioxygenase n=1 Tax=Arabis nemorensis TaxID=586526 RepID=A0A565C6L2_9BRAS|nr:unnamed protein product [Arabis nemorensis]